MKNFRTYRLAIEYYRACEKVKMPNALLKDQFDRARLSIPLNLAEGSGKQTRKDRSRFYSIALGSLRETAALLELSGNAMVDAQADQLAAHIYKLIQNPGSGR